MKEFIEKLIGRLEETCDTFILSKIPTDYDYCAGICHAIDIVKQLAEEYNNAEEQGLLLRLPCKLGDTIYCFGFEGEIIEGVCKAIQIDEKYKMVFIEGKDFCFWKMFEKFGKTVFLTKEEAEQTLKQMGE